MAMPWISIVTLGAILGFLGQSVRVVVGLKKARDKAAALGKTFTEAFEPSTMLVSLSMGGWRARWPQSWLCGRTPT
jgi:hypothetical protein